MMNLATIENEILMERFNDEITTSILNIDYLMFNCGYTKEELRLIYILISSNIYFSNHNEIYTNLFLRNARIRLMIK